MARELREARPARRAPHGEVGHVSRAKATAGVLVPVILTALTLVVGVTAAGALNARPAAYPTRSAIGCTQWNSMQSSITAGIPW